MPPPYGPMDFAAWFEVYLDDNWHTFDARSNTPRIGRILIARGRDASGVFDLSFDWEAGSWQLVGCAD